MGYAFWTVLVGVAAVGGFWPKIDARWRQWRQDRADLHRVRHAADHWRFPRTLP